MVKVVAVTSGKGGVGKSTVAAVLAYVMKGKGKNVGLLDLDIDGSNIPKIIGMPLAEPTVNKDSVNPVEYHGVKIMSMANIVLNDDLPVLLRGEQMRKWAGQMLNGVAWGDIDYLICDMPPSHGDATVTLLEALGDKIHGVVIVTTPSRVAMTDVRKTASLCQKFGLRIIGVVNNMSVVTCPHCESRFSVFGGRENVDKLSSDFAIGLVANIPILSDVEINPFVIAEYLDGVAESAMKWKLFG